MTVYQRAHRRGLTVFEVLLALGIFIVFYFVLLELWPLSARSIQQAKNVAVASAIAEQEMEYSIYQGYGSITDRSGSYTIPATVNRQPQSITVSYTLTVTSDTSSTKDVLVSVQWSEPAALPSAPAIQRKVQLETLLGQ